MFLDRSFEDHEHPENWMKAMTSLGEERAYMSLIENFAYNVN